MVQSRGFNITHRTIGNENIIIIIIDCCADLKRVWCTKRVQLLLSITKGKQTYTIIQYLLYTRPYIHIDKLLNSY